MSLIFRYVKLTINTAEWPNEGEDEEREPADYECRHDDAERRACLVFTETPEQFVCK